MNGMLYDRKVCVGKERERETRIVG